MVRLTDRPDMTLDVYRGRKTTMQQQQIYLNCSNGSALLDIMATRAMNRKKTTSAKPVDGFLLQFHRNVL